MKHNPALPPSKPVQRRLAAADGDDLGTCHEAQNVEEALSIADLIHAELAAKPITEAGQ